MVLKSRGPIYTPSESVIHDKLSSSRLVRNTKYLLLGFVAIAVGILLSLPGVSWSVLAATLSIGAIPIIGYFIWLEKNERSVREPIWMLVLAFAWGILGASLIVGLVYFVFFPDSLWCPGFPYPTQFCWIGYAGFVEEPAKFLGVFLIANSKRFSKQFDDHLDGLIIGAVIGLAFGFSENFGYIAMGPNGSPLTQVNWGIMFNNLPDRVLTPIGHMFMTGLAGWWVGYLKVNGMRITLKNIFPALFVSMVIHSAWDTWAALPTAGLRAFQAAIDPTGLIDVGAIIAFSILYFYLINKMAKEALHDEYFWGMSKGYVPLSTKPAG